MLYIPTKTNFKIMLYIPQINFFCELMSNILPQSTIFLFHRHSSFFFQSYHSSFQFVLPKLLHDSSHIFSQTLLQKTLKFNWFSSIKKTLFDVFCWFCFVSFCLFSIFVFFFFWKHDDLECQSPQQKQTKVTNKNSKIKYNLNTENK